MLTLAAAGKIGAKVVLLNTGFAAPQLADVCAREQVSAVVADEEFAAMLDVLPGLPCASSGGPMARRHCRRSMPSRG